MEGGIFWTGLPRKRVADFVAFDCEIRRSLRSARGVKNGSYCPGNDRCAVILSQANIVDNDNVPRLAKSSCYASPKCRPFFFRSTDT